MTATTLAQVVDKMAPKRPAPGSADRPVITGDVPVRCDPDCKECGGAGYVREAPGAQPGDPKFGEVRMCSRYLAKARAENIKRGIWDERCGLGASESEMDWKLVQPNINDAIRARDATREALERGHGMIMIFGTYGQGKTLIGKILIASALRLGRRAAYSNMASVLDDIRLAFDEREAKMTELIRRMDWWMGLDVLFIDELDKVNGTDWAQERMFELLDRRYVRAIREEALTVVASNRAVGELDGYLASRLRDTRLGPVLELNGPDARTLLPKGYKH